MNKECSVPAALVRGTLPRNRNPIAAEGFTGLFKSPAALRHYWAMLVVSAQVQQQ